MTLEHRHDPDPGRDRAIELIIEAFDNPRHQHEARDARDRLPGDGSHECLGCGHGGPDSPGYFECFGGGPSLYSYCVACHDEGKPGRIWSYRLPWPKWYRVLETLHPTGGQLAMSL